MPAPTYLPGPTPSTARKPSGQTLAVPTGWILLPPGDAALTRRVRGQRRELRRMFAQRSKELLGAYSRGEATARCLLAKALAQRSTNSGGGGHAGFTH
jgi:hypothetical protein